MLTKDQELVLSERGRNGCVESRNRLVEENYGLVWKIIAKLEGDRDEMFSEGVLGLIHAAGKFNADLGWRFSTYAYWWIKKYIISALNRNNTVMTASAKVHETKIRAAKSQDRLTQELMREPTDEEIANDLGVELWKISSLKSLEPHFHELPRDTCGESDLVQNLEHSEMARQLLARLTKREREYVMRRFGIGYPVHNDLEMMEHFKVSRQTVSTVCGRALSKMQKLGMEVDYA